MSREVSRGTRTALATATIDRKEDRRSCLLIPAYLSNSGGREKELPGHLRDGAFLRSAEASPFTHRSTPRSSSFAHTTLRTLPQLRSNKTEVLRPHHKTTDHHKHTNTQWSPAPKPPNYQRPASHPTAPSQPSASTSLRPYLHPLLPISQGLLSPYRTFQCRRLSRPRLSNHPTSAASQSPASPSYPGTQPARLSACRLGQEVRLVEDMHGHKV